MLFASTKTDSNESRLQPGAYFHVLFGARAKLRGSLWHVHHDPESMTLELIEGPISESI
jgi:hypothetical protein